MVKHLYQRTITKNGKKIKAWYYWYYDDRGRQVRKSCGQNGKPCLLKREAEAFIAALKDEVPEENDITFNDYCKDFYGENSRFLRKKIAWGYKYQPATIKQKQSSLDKFLSYFGNVYVKKITPGDIENWLVDLDCSNSNKNIIISTIEDVESELYSDHLIDYAIKIKHFKRNTHEKGILTLSEIARLWPEDYDSIIDIWRTRNFRNEREVYSFAVMIYTLLTTGMRNSEVRALQWNQFVRRDAILINAMVDSNNERVNRLKKWNEKNKKWRVTILPDRTVKMLELLSLDKADSDYVFVHNNERVKDGFLRKHFKVVLEKNGIDCEKRNIAIHSLRFTYNTLMRGEISGEDLRLMVGHASAKMTDYYDKSKALDHLDALLENKQTLNSVFN